MRQIKNSLNSTFEMDGAQFVEHQGDKNRHWETENQLQEIDNQCVFQRIRKADGTEDFFEKAKAYPCAFLKRTRNTKIAKSDLEIIQRIIAENQIERHAGQNKAVNAPCSPDRLKQATGRLHGENHSFL